MDDLYVRRFWQEPTGSTDPSTERRNGGCARGVVDKSPRSVLPELSDVMSGPAMRRRLAGRGDRRSSIVASGSRGHSPTTTYSPRFPRRAGEPGTWPGRLQTTRYPLRSRARRRVARHRSGPVGDPGDPHSVRSTLVLIGDPKQASYYVSVVQTSTYIRSRRIGTKNP